MKNNQYLSRYCAGETRFPRLDDTPWIPFEEDEPPLWVQICWGLALGAVVVLLIVLPWIWFTV